MQTLGSVLMYTDEPVLAKGFHAIMTGAEGFEHVHICTNLQELVSSALAAQPDVMLIDWTPELSFGMLAQVQRELPGCPVILWVRSIATELAYQAMEMGVRGILRKTLAPELVIKCLNKVSQGELWFDKNLTASFLSAKTVSLTRRESQLVSLLAQGLKNKEIAATLSISEGTVKVYFSRLFQKLGVKDRFELALYGLRNLQLSCPEPVRLDPRSEPRRPAPTQRLRSLVLDRPGEGPAPFWSSRS